MTTEQNLADRLEELREKATPGHWKAVRSDPAEGADVWWLCAGEGNAEKDLGFLAGGYPHDKHEANAAIITELVNNLPAIISALQSQAALIAELEKERDGWRRVAIQNAGNDHEAREGLTVAEARIAELEKERDEAQARAFRLADKVERLEDEARSSRCWLDNAKEARGYNTNVSFDTVWAETCAKADRLSDAVKVIEPFVRVFKLRFEQYPGSPDHAPIRLGYSIGPVAKPGDLTMADLRAANAFLSTTGGDNG